MDDAAADSQRHVLSIHGVAVAIGEHGLLIRGASGTGKSLLAAAMLRTWRQPAVRLVADDRVLITAVGGRLIARSHPAIAHQMELRGFGIVEERGLDAVVLRAVADLSDDLPERLPSAEAGLAHIASVTLPRVILPKGPEAALRLLTIWPHLARRMTIGQ